jgi:hypothetical protein
MEKLTLPCLSVQQPFADLICAGIKTVENRTWKTDYRGTILIHASGSVKPVKAMGQALAMKDNLPVVAYDPKYLTKGDMDVSKCKTEDELRQLIWYWKCYLRMVDDKAPVQTSAIIGFAHLIDIVDDADKKGNKWALPCQNHWMLEGAKFFQQPVVRINGKLRLYPQGIDGDLKTIDMLEWLENKDGLIKVINSIPDQAYLKLKE